ncbi:MAG TPA: ANTAR domain-containing protein [Actinomycetota bacterium]|nr:ANTAR domain-containing protein [Actinomycetota bacterium]
MDEDDPFSRELRSARDRIAELQRRSGGDPRRGLLPEALAELNLAIEELSVTGEELRAQTDELASTRQALEAERGRYQELFDSAPVPYLVTDAVARVREANRAAAALLGVDREFLTGKPLAAYVASADRWGFRSMVARLHRGDEDRVSDRPLRFRRRGGEVVTVAATVEPVHDQDGAPAALRWLLRRLGPEEMARPVLPDHHALAQDGARRSHLEALEDLDPAADLDGTVQVLMDAGVHLLGVDGIGLMLADTQGRLCAAGGSDEPAMAFLRAQEHAVKGPSVHAFLLERPVQAADLRGDARWAPLADAATVHSVGAAIAAPIGLFGGPVGACLLISRQPRRWADGDLAAAEGFAAVLAALLELAAEAQRSNGLSRQLQDLVQGQAVVEQAKGALMATKGIDADAAAAELRQLAQSSGRPLAEVAASLLRRLETGPR